MEVGLLVSLLPLLLSSLAVVTVDIAVLAHAIGVKLLVRAVPWFLVASILVVAVAAHTLGVVLLLRVTAIVCLLTE